MGYEKFVLDAEQCGPMAVLADGRALDENALAFDAFEEIGPDKHFLGAAHTMRNFETAFFDAELADSNSFEQWSEEGSLDARARANCKWKRMLGEYQAPPIDPTIDEALKAFVAEKCAAVPDARH